MNFISNVATTALSSISTILETWLPGGVQQGGEYKVKNPTRADASVGSFSINIHSGAWADFATGDKGGDLVSLVAYVDSCSQKDAAIKLEQFLHLPGRPAPAPTAPQKPDTKYTRVSPAPADAPALPKQRHVKIAGKTGPDSWKHYDIIHYWPYHNITGSLLGYVVRYETPEGKETPPLTLWRAADGQRDGGSLQWKFKGFDDPRPLFNLHKLGANPTLQIILVEGEKCAEALQALIDAAGAGAQLVAMTWPGGAQAIKKPDWRPLSGRRVILWPDADKPGAAAMQVISGILGALGCKIKTLQIPDGQPAGWDVADAILNGWDLKRIIEFIKQYAIDVTSAVQTPASSPAMQPTGSEPADTPAPDSPETDDISADCYDFPFLFLGYHADFCYYLPDGTRQVRALKVDGHSSAALIGLAPLQFWERNFMCQNGPAWKQAANTLIRASEHHGPYDPLRLRGRGAWFDNRRVIINQGNGLIIDGKEIDFKELKSVLKSKFIYESGVPLKFSTKNPLSTVEANRLRKITDFLIWEDKSHSPLLAGWIVLAPVCGALKWRPHIWLSGGAGTGKSFVLDNIIKPCLGETKIFAQSTTTSAGIRQILGSDSRPVMIDEFEAEDLNGQGRIQAMLELARQASSDNGASIYKGSQNGKPMQFQVRSMFCMSSIGVNIEMHADESRVTVLSLRNFQDGDYVDDVGEPGSRSKHFSELKRMVDDLSDEWFDSLRARTIKLLPVIAQNAEIFAVAIAEKLKNRRAGDQLGALYAGAYSLSSEKVITPAQALQIIDARDFTDQREILEESDERKCLNFILEHQLKTQSNEMIPIGELIEQAYGVVHTEYELDGAPIPDLSAQTDALKLLSRNGVNCQGDYVLIANSYSSLQRILYNTPWPKNYGRILERMPGAIKKHARFCGILTRTIGIKKETFIQSNSI